MTPAELESVKTATEAALSTEQVQALIQTMEMIATRLEFLCALGKFAIFLAVLIGIYWLFGRVFFRGV